MGSSSKPSKAATPERRADQRLATQLRAVIETADGTLTFTAKGFSRSGAFLERRDQDAMLPAVGSVVHLVFHWPLETHIAPVQVEATVIHHTPDGMGVKFQIA